MKQKHAAFLLSKETNKYLFHTNSKYRAKIQMYEIYEK